MGPASRQLIQVAPGMTPPRCGVSDHAIALGLELKAEDRTTTPFVTLNSDEWAKVAIDTVRRRPNELLGSCVMLSRGEPTAILVYLNGFGYSTDGVRALLAKALEQK